jgi:hypothetical protein
MNSEGNYRNELNLYENSGSMHCSVMNEMGITCSGTAHGDGGLYVHWSLYRNIGPFRHFHAAKCN